MSRGTNGSELAHGAEKRPSLREDNPPDHRLAAATRHTATPVDGQFLLKLARHSCPIDVIVDAGTPIGYGFAHHFAQTVKQWSALRAAQAPRSARRPDACVVQRLACVDVADPREVTLVEQPRLDRRRTAACQFVQSLWRQRTVEWIDPDAERFAHVAFDDAPAAEFASVRERKSSTVFVTQQEPDMFRVTGRAG